MNDFPNGHFKVGPGLNINSQSYQPPHQISDPSSLYHPAVPYPHVYTPAHPAFSHQPHASRHIQQINQQAHHHLSSQQHSQHLVKHLHQHQHKQLSPPPGKSSSGSARLMRDHHNAGRTSPAQPQDLVKDKKLKIRSYQDKAVETDRDQRSDDHNTSNSNKDDIYDEQDTAADMFLEAKMEYESSVDDPMEDSDSRMQDELKPDQNRKPCPECGKLLTNVREHVKSVHWQVKNYICDFCTYSTSFKTDLAKHRKSRHSHLIDEINKTPIQPIMAATSSASSPFPKNPFANYLPPPQIRPVMPVHQPKLNPNSPVGALPGPPPPSNTSSSSLPPPSGLNSITCPPSFRSDDDSQLKSPRLKDCEECGKSVININEHIRYVHRREKNYSCPECDYKTLFKCDLVKHQNAVHQKIRKVCTFCGKHVANLAEHVRFVHKHAKKHKCENCNYACVKQSDLRKHVAAVHKWSKGLLHPGAAAAALAAATSGSRKTEGIKVEGR